MPLKTSMLMFTVVHLREFRFILALWLLLLNDIIFCQYLLSNAFIDVSRGILIRTWWVSIVGFQLRHHPIRNCWTSESPVTLFSSSFFSDWNRFGFLACTSWHIHSTFANIPVLRNFVVFQNRAIPFNSFTLSNLHGVPVPTSRIG